MKRISLRCLRHELKDLRIVTMVPCSFNNYVFILESEDGRSVRAWDFEYPLPEPAKIKAAFIEALVLVFARLGCDGTEKTNEREINETAFSIFHGVAFEIGFGGC